VVACQHDHANAGCAAATNRGGRSGTKRVTDPYEAKRGQFLGIFNGGMSWTFGDKEDAQALSGERGRPIQQSRPTVVVEWYIAIFASDIRAAPDEDFDGSLDRYTTAGAGGVK
jgi:hypothetical protein